MEEAKVSWNTIYADHNGFECQITLRDDDEESLAERVAKITGHILEAGGIPLLRRSQNGSRSDETGGSATSDPSKEEPLEKTYIDQKGIRRCNLKLKTGRRCNQPATEKEGRYGLFWSCPNYKEHAPPRSR